MRPLYTWSHPLVSREVGGLPLLLGHVREHVDPPGVEAVLLLVVDLGLEHILREDVEPLHLLLLVGVNLAEPGLELLELVQEAGLVHSQGRPAKNGQNNQY